MSQNTDFPLIELGDVFHVGSLESSNKRAGSHEGKGLSVSLHPEAWIQIARLGGEPTWRLSCADGRFLDFHAISPQQWAEIKTWAIERGYVSVETIFCGHVYDDELEDSLIYASMDRMSVADELDISPKELSEGPGPVLTELGLQQAGYRTTRRADDGVTYAKDGMALLYAEEVLKMDGVWFEDNLDPVRLSAPRGVIFPSAVTRWSVTKEVEADLPIVRAATKAVRPRA